MFQKLFVILNHDYSYWKYLSNQKLCFKSNFKSVVYRCLNTHAHQNPNIALNSFIFSQSLDNSKKILPFKLKYQQMKIGFCYTYYNTNLTLMEKIKYQNIRNFKPFSKLQHILNFSRDIFFFLVPMYHPLSSFILFWC